MMDRIGVLLINLGTPQQPEPSAVKAFLAEFLHDQRVVDMTRWLWCPLLHGIILPFRSPKVARLYRKIWTAEGSPLLANSIRQRDRLQEVIDMPVAVGMTYGQPSIDLALEELESQGCTKVLVLPLYPQFSATTTAAGIDKLAQALQRRSNLPEMRTVNHYYQQPLYVDALAQSVRDYWEVHGESDYLLCSYHGIPQRYSDNGDPYAGHCVQTSYQLQQALALEDDQFGMSYQSIFGREEWLKPYTEQTLIALARSGTKRIDVITPAFASDCLETLEEIAIQCRDTFIQHGGEQLRLIPCLNDRDDHIALLTHVIHHHTKEW
ncbi:ferrochelatase [Thaumasiovibrio sp. DFM-14]|uniref:ferrochelatase n=1 Tax=Thaumasiovibrio sp. DFM-14 TaxID=3384792 RepID=UPI0039A132FB